MTLVHLLKFTHLRCCFHQSQIRSLRSKHSVLASYIRHVLAKDVSSTIEIKENRTTKNTILDTKIRLQARHVSKMAQGDASYKTEVSCIKT